MAEDVELQQAGAQNENDQAAEPDQPKKRTKLGRRLLILIAAVVVVALAVTIGYFTYQGNNFVTTDNALVESDMITVPSMITGTIAGIDVNEGDYVHKGDVIAHLDPTSLTTTQIDDSYVRSTVDGTVLKTVGTTGQQIAAGTTVAYLAQESDLYVIANIDEKSINKVKVGQDVDVTIDQFGGQPFYGKVTAIDPATQGAFSVVSSSATGTFTRTTQYVPVEIRFIEQYPGLIVGANAAVSVHIS